MNNGFAMLAQLKYSISLRLVVACAAVALIGSCATNQNPSQGRKRHAENTTISEQHIEELETQFQENPENAEMALAYARGLRKAEKFEDAIAVLMRASLTHSEDVRVLAEFGKALVELGHADRALQLLRKAEAELPDEWSILSAQGVALDQLGRHDEALRVYGRALLEAPDHPSILSNMGLSYALKGDLGQAESLLKKAARLAPGNQDVQLNLALVVGLQGRFDEAFAIASAHLPASRAEHNVAYLKSLLSQPARWRDMEAVGLKTTYGGGEAYAPKPFDASIDVRTAPVKPVDTVDN